MTDQPSRLAPERAAARLVPAPAVHAATALALTTALLLVAAPLATAQPAAAPAAAEGFRCSLKDAAGVEPADAGTATRLLCEALQRESQGRGAFEVSLGALGRLILLTAARADGTLSTTVQLEQIEELPVAAARVARTLVHGEAFAATGRVDNLIESETRLPKTRRGSVKFTAGVADIEWPGHGARASGLGLGFVYTSTRFSLPAEMRFGWDDAEYGGEELSLFSLSVGGRALLSTRDTSPFVGGGLGVLRLSASEYGREGASFYGERFAAAPYVEVGVEFLRTYRGRVAVFARADVPFSSVRSESSGSYSPTGQWVEQPSSRSRYVLPVTIGASVAF